MVSFHLDSVTWQVVGQALTISDHKYTAANEMTFDYCDFSANLRKYVKGEKNQRSTQTK